MSFKCTIQRRYLRHLAFIATAEDLWQHTPEGGVTPFTILKVQTSFPECPKKYSYYFVEADIVSLRENDKRYALDLRFGFEVATPEKLLPLACSPQYAVRFPSSAGVKT